MPELNAIKGRITLDGKEYVMGLSAVNAATDKTTQKIERQFDATLSRVESIGKKLSLAVTAPLVLVGYKSAEAFGKSDEAVTRLKATLEATGGVVGRTVGQLTRTATEIQRATTFDDEDVLAMSATLVKFGNVVGDTFDRAQGVIVDFAAATGQTLASASSQVGRALSDPATGMMMLRREGYALTAQQKKAVEQMLKLGDVQGAQAVILGMLESKTRGTAKAMASLGLGRVKQAWNDVGDAMEKVGGVIVTAIQPAVVLVRDLALRFQELSPGAQQAIVAVGALAAGIGPAIVAGANLVQAYTTVKTALMSATTATYAYRTASLLLNPVLLIVAGSVGVVAAALAIGQKNTDKANEAAVEYNRTLNATKVNTVGELAAITDKNKRLEESRLLLAKINAELKQQQGRYFHKVGFFSTDFKEERNFNRVKADTIARLEARKKEIEALMSGLKDAARPAGRPKSPANFGPTEAQATAAKGMYDETRTPLERYKESMRELNALRRSGAFEGMGDVFDREVKKVTQNLYASLPAIVGVTNAMQSAFDTAFSSMISGTMTMRQAIKSMVDDVLNQLARMVASNLFKTFLNFAIPGLFGKNAGAGILGALFGKGQTSSAKGNAFTGPIRPFAKGGSFVNGPTLFPMATGSGVMGEAGPEGVFPLARDGSGRLGIRGDNAAIRDLEARIPAMVRDNAAPQVHQHFHYSPGISFGTKAEIRQAAFKAMGQFRAQGAF